MLIHHSESGTVRFASLAPEIDGKTHVTDPEELTVHRNGILIGAFQDLDVWDTVPGRCGLA
jgi:hypothetical protein